MDTIIIGAGIIGVSTAYYLSEIEPKDSQRIHLIEASPELFSSASGFAGGFLAADWFSPALARLGLLSFRLHKDLAEQHNGHELWGYSRSTSTSLAADNVERNGSNGADWLREGVSRATAAENTDPHSGNAPLWIKSKGALDVLSNGETTAQVEPRKLCDYLISVCLSRGVQLHQPCRALELIQSKSGRLSETKILNSSTSEIFKLPCSRLVVAAGAWSSQVLAELFPNAKYRPRISALAGHSLVLRSKQWPPPRLDPTDPGSAQQGCHAVFTTEEENDYSPELMSRMPNGEIYLAGLNSSTYPLPELANDKTVDQRSIQILRRTAQRLCGNEVEIVRESVCWRPVTSRGTPIVAELEEALGDAGKGVYLAAGHGPWGISLSLGTGHCVARMVRGEDVSEYIGRLRV